ncbi:MAG: hypothetical protein Q3985_04980 [Eubacteriales bacterium]|nr:hypothetical protein [Eubacteriales bacterium]
MKFTEEQMKKFNEAESVEEAIALAKEEGLEVSEEEIGKYYNATHIPARGKEGELSDDELDSVAGGACAYSDGRQVVNSNYGCDHWEHHNCGGTIVRHIDFCDIWYTCSICQAGSVGHTMGTCESCKYCVVENGQWLCNYDANRK